MGPNPRPFDLEFNAQSTSALPLVLQVWVWNHRGLFFQLPIENVILLPRNLPSRLCASASCVVIAAAGVVSVVVATISAATVVPVVAAAAVVSVPAFVLVCDTFVVLPLLQSSLLFLFSHCSWFSSPCYCPVFAFITFTRAAPCSLWQSTM